ncbi:hypothetical protein GCM10007036_11880 [Alsobacter metallidurans]|uniref:MlaB-like STAS domain-containing protein n=1 Tax=Alsobacter metallidurans TaxID=340221 RepID=A0A917MG84_9HYPH|nr:STAS domain-containing protein [Alsobacter metallidurans]GGH13356.1 hypothetical protein GCM10007036_11880 [Alsobacter metallidurans]
MVDLALSTRSTRDEVVDLCNKMKDAFADGKEVRLDGSAAEDLSPTLAQVIVSAGRTARESGQGFTLISPSTAMIDGFQGYGLFAELMTIPME